MPFAEHDGWSVQVHLRIRVPTNKQPEFLAFLREAIPYYEAPGGVRVTLLTEAQDPERFIELVEYASEAAYANDDERVRSDPTMARYLERWRTLLAEPPAVEVYRPTRLI